MTQKTDRAEQAIDYIITCCPNIGSFSNFDSPGSESLFLKETAAEIARSDDSFVFPAPKRGLPTPVPRKTLGHPGRCRQVIITMVVISVCRTFALQLVLLNRHERVIDEV